MDLRETLARMKPLMGVVALLGAAGAWLLVFESGWQSGDWAGFWSSSATEVRGDAVDTHGKRVETPLEREKRLGIEGKHVNETLYQAKKKILGERDQTRGNDIEQDRGDVPNMYRSTEREACYEMKLEFPDRYKNVDCMSPELKDEPWLPGAPPRYEEEDDDKAAKRRSKLDGPGGPTDPVGPADTAGPAPPAEAPDPPAWMGNMRKSPLGRPDPPADPDPAEMPGRGAPPDPAP